jgi:hypothetical protein
MVERRVGRRKREVRRICSSNDAGEC